MAIDITSETLINLTEAGRRLGCGRAAIRALINAGRLDGLHVPTAGGFRTVTSLEALARSTAPVEHQRAAAAPRKMAKSTEAILKKWGVM